MLELGLIYLTRYEKFFVSVVEILLETIPKTRKRQANPMYFSCIFRTKGIVQSFIIYYERVVPPFWIMHVP